MRIALRFIQDFECGEFHITPVLTLSWPSKEMKVKGLALGLEWGSWAVMLLVYKKRFN